jgi:hypothetical protein
MSDDYEYFKNKRNDRVYLSRSLEAKQLYKDEGGNIKELVRPFRIVSKVIDGAENHEFIKEGKEVSLRVTDGERQEITAKFYEDTRGIFTLQIQRYSVKSGNPHHTHFTFIGAEIPKLYNFIRNIPILPIKDQGNAKLDDKFLEEIVLSRQQLIDLVKRDPGLVKELIQSQITKQDIVNFKYRKEQLEVFSDLLTDDAIFDARKITLGQNKGDEDVWQDFFEKNTWIFGYGLSYLFNKPLDGKKLEQVTRGHSAFGRGKRVDALLKSQGVVSSLCFCEIKTHKTPLLKKTVKAYRPECWAVHDEVVGGIAQIQKTVQLSLESIKTKTQITDDSGALTGEEMFLYQPKSFLVVGSLSEFEGDYGINDEKFSSFELFRKHVTNPEIITFDELYARAKFIVEADEVMDDDS